MFQSHNITASTGKKGGNKQILDKNVCNNQLMKKKQKYLRITKTEFRETTLTFERLIMKL